METLEYYEWLIVEKFLNRLDELGAKDLEEDRCAVLDVMHEVVEMRLPLFSESILSIAASYPPLAKTNCSSWPAWDIDTPLNHIIMNIHEYLFGCMYEKFLESEYNK